VAVLRERTLQLVALLRKTTCEVRHSIIYAQATVNYFFWLGVSSPTKQRESIWVQVSSGVDSVLKRSNEMQGAFAEVLGSYNRCKHTTPRAVCIYTLCAQVVIILCIIGPGTVFKRHLQLTLTRIASEVRTGAYCVQLIATHCNTLQHTATHQQDSHTLPRVAGRRN